MKRSILHTLLVAMISIFIWSFYTVYQDVRSSRQDWGYQYDFTVGVDDYTPLLTQSGRQQTLFPVYKGAHSSHYGYQMQPSRSSGRLFSSNTFGISQINNNIEAIGYGEQNNVYRRSSSVHSMIIQQSSLVTPTIKPFSQGLEVVQDRESALAVAIRQKSSKTLSQSGTMRKAFGEGDGGDIVGDSGIENNDAYNDSIYEVVVGDGYSFIMILLFIYFLFKNRNKLVYKSLKKS